MDERSNLPLPERWHEAAMVHADAEAAAQLLEESRSTVLSQRKMALIKADPKLSDARAETIVKSSDEWRLFIEGMVRARKHANRSRVARDYIKMRFQVWISDDANHRAGVRMS